MAFWVGGGGRGDSSDSLSPFNLIMPFSFVAYSREDVIRNAFERASMCSGFPVHTEYVFLVSYFNGSTASMVELQR